MPENPLARLIRIAEGAIAEAVVAAVKRMLGVDARSLPLAVPFAAASRALEVEHVNLVIRQA